MKIRFVLFLLVLAGLLAPTAALADENQGFDLGLRFGYGIPLGELAEGADLNDFVENMIPIWLDAGYRINANNMVGIYFHYAVLSLAADCLSGIDCSADDFRVGLQWQYRIIPKGIVDPWLGIGFGLEWADMSAEVLGEDVAASYFGIEFFNLQAGVDFQVVKGLGIGPFVSFSLGQYQDVSYSCDGVVACEGDDSIDDKGLHEWLVFGLRGTYGF